VVVEEAREGGRDGVRKVKPNEPELGKERKKPATKLAVPMATCGGGGREGGREGK